MSNMRQRAVQVELLDTEGDEGRVRALVTTFDKPYVIGRNTTETIKRETFTDGVVPIYFQHGHGEVPIGHAANMAAERGTELDVQFYLDTDRGLATYRAIKAGALKEWSVGFTCANDDVVAETRDGVTNETIERGDLLEVSVVLRGANPRTETLEVREAPVVEAPTIPAAWLERMAEPHIRALIAGLAK